MFTQLSRIDRPRQDPRLILAIAGALAFALTSIPFSLGDDTPPVTVIAANPLFPIQSAIAVSDARNDSSRNDPLVIGQRADNRIAQEIRDTLALESDLSVDAKNVKIVANQGSVILKGNVASAAEKAKVEEIARRSAKTGLVENGLKVNPRN